MIKNKMVLAREFSKDITESKFPQADRLKISKKEFSTCIEGSYSTGQLSAIETLLNENKHNPYQDVECILGDLHILFLESWESVRKTYPGRGIKLSLEDLLEQQGLLVQDEKNKNQKMPGHKASHEEKKEESWQSLFLGSGLLN